MLAATALATLTGAARAQSWADDFDAYSHGDAVEMAGAANGWESWSSGIGTSTVTALPPAPTASSLPNSLCNEPGADTVLNYTRLPRHPTSGQWRFSGKVWHGSGYLGRHYWIMLNTYNFGGPFSWSVQTYFDGTQGIVDCDCNFQNDPNGPRALVRDAWVPIRAEIDLDGDGVDVFYNGASLTAGQQYPWTGGPFGVSSGILEIQALDLYPDVPGHPVTTTMYYDDLLLEPAERPLGLPDVLCAAVANSTGSVAQLSLEGTGNPGQPVFATCTSGPPGEFGYVLSGPTPGYYQTPPGSSGVLCITTPQYRYNSVALGQVFQFDGAGVSQAVAGGGPSELPTDGSFAPVPGVMLGDTRVFQAWFRDVGFGSNFSESRIVGF
jgi:hypothetical protein